MRQYISARRRKQAQPLTGLLIRALCAGIFPERNNCNPSNQDFDELVPELARYGLSTRLHLKQLLTRYRRALMQMDRAPFDETELTIYVEGCGADKMHEHIRRQYFYAHPAFVRNALELQFGAAACVTEPEAVD